MPEQFEIQGGTPLKGTIDVRGAKNATFPVLAATLLTQKPCTVHNIPLIEDVFRMLELMQSLGVHVEWVGERSVKIVAKEIDLEAVRRDVVSRFRGSILLYGSLLSRVPSLRLPKPGGCVLGARPIDTHLNAFEQFGVTVREGAKNISLKMSSTAARVKQREVIMREFSVTATCNALLVAAALPGETRITIADEDYQVQSLLEVLRDMGVEIINIGHHEITVRGTKTLKGFTHTVLPDPIEAGTFIVLAAACKGDVTVRGVETEVLKLFLQKLTEAGLPMDISKAKKTVHVKPWRQLHMPRIQSLPYPGVQTDLLSAIAVLATQTEGATLIQEPLYEGRFKYLEELNQMGANIFFADPHRVVVTGPTKLLGKNLGSLDIRSGAALIIAGLAAEGTSRVGNIYQIDRGYEKIEERLRKIGADITRIEA